MTATTDCFRFLNLPPEIRNTIYNLLLTHKHDDHAAQIKVELGTFEKNPAGLECRFAGTMRSKPRASLLATCHQVHTEARWILYSCNRFRFSDSCAFERFARSIGSNRPLLRDVSMVINGIGLPVAKPGLRLLSECTGVTRLNLDFELRHFYLSVDYYTKLFVLDLWPIVEMLFGREKSVEKVFEVIKIRPRLARHSVVANRGRDRWEIHLANQTLEKRFKHGVSYLLTGSS